MRRLCTEQGSCVRTRLFVNNLKAVANAEVPYDERIRMTPHGAYFPDWSLWLAQAVEDWIELLIHTFSIGAPNETSAIAAAIDAENELYFREH